MSADSLTATTRRAFHVQLAGFVVPSIVHLREVEQASRVLRECDDHEQRVIKLALDTSLPAMIADKIALLTVEEFTEMAKAYVADPEAYIDALGSRARRAADNHGLAAKVEHGSLVIPDDVSALDPS